MRFFGRDLDIVDDETRQALQRRWGVLFQNGALYSSLTVTQNVQFPMREFLRLPEHLLDEIAATKLAMVGLSGSRCKQAPFGTFRRHDEARRIGPRACARPRGCVSRRTDVRPGPYLRGDFDSLIRTLQRTLGLTVFMITHDLNSLHAVCDRIAVLADGKIVADGPISTMLASEHPWVKSYFRGQRGRLLERSHEQKAS